MTTYVGNPKILIRGMTYRVLAGLLLQTAAPVPAPASEMHDANKALQCLRIAHLVIDSIEETK
jgi:hypothetical protein